MTLNKPLTLTLGLMLAGTSLAVSSPRQDSDFQLLTREEASALKESLGSLEGTEREARRQAEYERLRQRAREAGYAVPPLATAGTAAQPPEQPAATVPAPATSPETPATPAPGVTPGTPAVATDEKPAATESRSPAPAPAPTAETETTPAATEPPAVAAEEKTAPPVAPEPAAQPDTDTRPATEASATPYSGRYQGIRRSHEELLKSMEARRDALREQMRKRREEMARGRAPSPVSEMEQQRQAEIEARQKQHEEEMLARQKEMEARRKAMEARINSAINGIGRPVAPYYPPAYRPYGAYAPWGYPAWPVYPAR